MAAIFSFRCDSCGEIHEGSPSFAFRAPAPYVSLTDEQKQEMGKLGDDFCKIRYDDRTDYFVRGVLEVPIDGIDQPFLWGVWVSLSEKSFTRYVETFDDPVEGEGFFGWLCNVIPEYPYHVPRAADVIVRTGRERPRIVLHRGEPEDDLLVNDQVCGITVARAQWLAEKTMHR